MKKIILFILCILCIDAAVLAQSYSYLGTFTSNGVPNYLTTRDTVSQGLLSRVGASLPEGYPVPTYNPQYITTGTKTDITLNDSADVWVTFVGEGAGYKNVLGYYTYNKSNPPTSVPSNANIKIIFPNVSASGSGGGLFVGDRVKIGTFPPNTGIGWVLLANGYRNNAVTSGHWRVFSEPDFNPENDSTLRFHNVLLRDTATQCVILGFEDIRRDYSSCDNDFNDALFYVKSNPVTAIDTGNINISTQAGQGVSSGNSSGLESHSGLSQMIGKRNINRAHSNYQIKSLYTNENALEAVISNNLSSRATQKGTSSIDLLSYVPEGIIASNKSYVSSPTDLIGITTAKEVVGVDYMNGEEVVAALLTTLTEGQVYDHTKVICDRLKGAELKNIELKNYSGYKLIQSCIVRETKEVEYAISFSLVPDGQGKYYLESLWNLSDYSKGDEVINMQVWSKTPAYTQELVTSLIKNASESLDISQIRQPELPSTYVKKAYYSSGRIKMEMNNNSSVRDITMRGTISESETMGQIDFVDNISINGVGKVVTEINTDYIFDAGVALIDNGKQIDFLYQADGQWGLDYQKENVIVESFNVEKNSIESKDEEYVIERPVKLKAKTSDYVSVYRFFKPNAQVMDISKYNSLKIDFEGNEELKVTLMINGLNWQEYPNVLLSSNEMELSLKEFGDYEAEKVIGLIFTPVIVDEKIELNINRLSLSTDETLMRTDDLELKIYPNPVQSNIHIASKCSSEAIFYVRDLTGRVLKQAAYSKEGIDVRDLTNGVYIIEQVEEDKVKATKFVLMR